MTDVPGGETIAAEVVVVGAGLAGLFTALKLAPLPVLLISKAPLGEGASSGWAQGGIAAAVGPDDSPARHCCDTLAAAAGIGDAATISLITRESAARIRDLLDFGVTFDRTTDGALALGREAAHSRRRILHAGGDRTGQEVMRALVQAVRAAPHITIISGSTAETLIEEDGRIAGVEALTTSNGAASGGADTVRRRYIADAVVLATGGLGQLYSYTTNPPQATGDGLAMAARAGVDLSDMEFVQFHPTALNIGASPLPLATEALRGEGAHLITAKSGRFMLDVHPDGELAPRDVVARAVWERLQRGEIVFLDCRAALGDRLRKSFPGFYANCRAAHIDPRTMPVPVVPAAHYHMGGIAVNDHGRTSREGLWACGEVAATGVHGANRLASNSLLEALVFAERVAQDIAGTSPRRSRHAASALFRAADEPARRNDGVMRRLREVMYRDVGLVRDRPSLLRALAEFDELSAQPDGLAQRDRDRLKVARLIACSALHREESRGSHFRCDHPELDETQNRRSFLRANHRTPASDCAYRVTC